MLGEWLKLELKEGWRSWGKAETMAPVRSGDLAADVLPKGVDAIG
jgi:hypothetical protein